MLGVCRPGLLLSAQEPTQPLLSGRQSPLQGGSTLGHRPLQALAAPLALLVHVSHSLVQCR